VLVSPQGAKKIPWPLFGSYLFTLYEIRRNSCNKILFSANEHCYRFISWNDTCSHTLHEFMYEDGRMLFSKIKFCSTHFSTYVCTTYKWLILSTNLCKSLFCGFITSKNFFDSCYVSWKVKKTGIRTQDLWHLQWKGN
jgi:hypothetical protein